MSTREDAWGLVTNAAGVGGTSLVLPSGHGARFPANTVGYFARIYNLADPGINERIYVGGRSTDTLTPVTRNYDGRGAQNITASGWAIESLHDISLVEYTINTFVNQTNTAAIFEVYAGGLPSTQHLGFPKKYPQAGDVLHHHQFYIFVNNSATPRQFNLGMAFGLFGVSATVYATYAPIVPAGATYYIECETWINFNTTGTQSVTCKVTTMSTAGVSISTLLFAANFNFDTQANNWQFLHTGSMAVADPNLFFQGYSSFTELLKSP